MSPSIAEVWCGAVPSSLREMSVAVLFGGTSSEAAISRTTGEAVLGALRATREAGRGPGRIAAVELGSEAWMVDGEARSLGAAVEELRAHDLCFLALHGGDGEDGHVQSLLDLVGVAYTGSGPSASSLAMDKWNSRVISSVGGLRVAEAVLAGRAGWEDRERAEVQRLLAASPTGVCVKPRHGGSSVGVARARDVASAEHAVLAVLETGDEAVIEAWTEGVEVAVGVLGNRADGPRGLTPVEIRPHAGRFFDYEEKYSDTGATELCPPESLDGEQCALLEQLALRAHAVLGCDGYSRSDFIVDRDGQPVFLELNSLPGLTPRSLLPLASRRAGIEFEDLCLGIAASGLARRDGRP